MSSMPHTATLVFGDMMFRVSVGDGRDRAIVRAKVAALLRMGPAGVWRLLRNAVRFVGRRTHKPDGDGAVGYVRLR